MAADSRPRFLVHMARVAIAVAVSTATLVGLVTLDRTLLRAYPLMWFTAPIAIGAGYIPLWRWYPREAFPIGLVFCPAMFFALRYFYEWFGPWIWRN